jgi:prepilin-type N-terminal cleavage/methylation domain-containing protein
VTYRRGFTLIELLVVISIIGLLVSILLPALAASRRSAINAKCLANLKQIATAMISYEADQKRLPMGVREVATAGDATVVNGGAGPIFPASVRYTSVTPAISVSTAPLYLPYMDVEYFVCPLVPTWSINDTLTATTGSVNSDYYMTPGYYGDGAGAAMTSWFTRSDKPWTYDGNRMSVLVGDKSYWNPHADANGTYIIFNHVNIKGANEWRPGSFGGFAYRYNTTDDTVRYQQSSNHAFADGSARGFTGTDRLIPVNGLFATRPSANYLMPVTR